MKRRSIAVFPLNMGGSNGPKLELDAIFTPPYEAGRLGVTLTSSPKQADVILLYGNCTRKMVEPVKRLLASLPDEVKLVLVGSEAISAEPFGSAYGVVGLLSKQGGAGILPPDKTIAAYITGTPPDPQSIIKVLSSEF